MNKWILYILVLSVITGAVADDDFIDEAEEGTGFADQSMVSGLDLKQVQSAWNDSKADANIKRYNYSPKNTYKISLREIMDTTLILPEGEEIDGYAIGDSSMFFFITHSQKPLLEKRKNIGIIRPKNPGVDTNLTVFGSSGNIYSFYLRTDSIKSENLPHLIVYIDNHEFTERYKAEQETLSLLASTQKIEELNAIESADSNDDVEQIDYLNELPPIEPTKINRSYEIVSDRNSLAPLEIFDDGVAFTYFKFGDNDLTTLEEAPALYRVMDGFDVPVNFEVKDGHYIAKMIHPAWTLRAGEKHLCIRKKGG